MVNPLASELGWNEIRLNFPFYLIQVNNMISIKNVWLQCEFNSFMVTLHSLQNHFFPTPLQLTGEEEMPHTMVTFQLISSDYSTVFNVLDQRSLQFSSFGFLGFTLHLFLLFDHCFAYLC